jgi:arylsulfatase A-like enzyme
MIKLKILFFVLILILFSCKEKKLAINSSNAIVSEKPNFLFILVDDLGVKDLGFTGSTFYETPNIDALAKKGFIFTQGYANSRVCSPSRASILTGKFTARHGITDWIGAKTNENWRQKKRNDKMLPASYVKSLPENDITIAEAMQANGYKTFFAGKWHLGEKGSYPEDHGFDINIGGFHSGSPKGGYFSPYKNPNLKNKVDGENLSIRLANETSSFIKEHKQEPFFAFLSFYAVHGPIQTNQEKWQKYKEKATLKGVKKSGYKMEKKLPIRQVQDNPIYAGLVATMDDAVGLVLKALKDNNLDKNTIVIFTSDNGGVASGDNFSTSNLPYKGGKGYQWEGGIREPYLIYVPWRNSNVNSSDYPVTGADFYPTILEYANIDLLENEHKDGISLKSIIDKNQVPNERALYWHYPHYGNQGGDPSSIIRKGKWKLIHYYENNSNELYNLENDPFEMKNFAKKEVEVTKELLLNLKNWLVAVNAKYPKVDSLFNQEKRELYDNQIKNKKLPSLEKQRLKMLSEDFIPNKDWWGSKITKD